MILRSNGGRSYSTKIDGVKYTILEEPQEFDDRVGNILLNLFSKQITREPDIEPASVVEEYTYISGSVVIDSDTTDEPPVEKKPRKPRKPRK